MALDPRPPRIPQPRAAIAALVAGNAQYDYGSAEDAAATTFAADTAALDALEEQAAGSGILLVLEDLQWADGATYRLLERLAVDIRRLSLLVVATHRDPSHPALDRTARPRRHRGAATAAVDVR